MAGGEIWYQYIGTTAHPHRYNVYLGLYRDVSGIELCYGGSCTKQICISSSCFNTINLTVNQIPFTSSNIGGDTTLGTDGSIITPSMTDCVDSNSPGIVTTEYYLFSGQVDLPGTCADYKFSFSENARNPSDNVTLAGNFDIEATLNNIIGHNSSPEFLVSGNRDFCIGKSYQWIQTAKENDGDSLYYEFTAALSGNCGEVIPPSVTYTTGYTAFQPIQTANGVSLGQNGIISFTPIQQEVDVVTIKIKEYRFVPSLSDWLQIGSIMRDMLVPITAQCDTTNFMLKSPSDSLANSTLNGKPSQTISCGDSIIHITLNKKFSTGTLAPDGSDFGLVNSEGQVMPIIKAGTNVGPYSETNHFWLKLYNPIYYDDTLILYSRLGNDLNTLLSNCADELPVNDTIYIISNGCNTRFSISKSEKNNIAIFPNPAHNHISVVLNGIATKNTYALIMDLSGKVLIKRNLHAHENRIELKNLSQGTFMLSIIGKDIRKQQLIEKH